MHTKKHCSPFKKSLAYSCLDEKLLKENGIEVAGIEYIKDHNGTHYTYDINTNTNYNSIAERKIKDKGMDAIAKFLNDELKLN